MKVSLSWIKELLPALDASVEEIASGLTSVGIEVEEVAHEAQAFANVVVGEARSVGPHPDADKLRLVTVFDGTVDHQVVCGAANVAAGQKVVFGKVGAKLPNGLELVPRKIRGQHSAGMICSEDELGLVDVRAAGIMVLDAAAVPGTPIASVIDREDVAFELGVTPNRADVLSHLGVARELAAIHGLPLPDPKSAPAEVSASAAKHVAIEISAPEKCSAYVGRVLEGIRVGPSPAWVVRRLEAVGLRSISNVVDATNLALMELGHPLHAFDLDKIGGSKIVVRTARAGEKMRSLDGEERRLVEDDLVIADANVPVALAGVMGGADSEVGEGTTRVLLEAAMFDPRTVRRTARRHGLHTDASHRFERGADPRALARSIDRCAALILELAGGTLLAGHVEAVAAVHQPHSVSIRPVRAARLLGRPVEAAEVTATLVALGLTPAGEADGALSFTVPSWRVDLVREEDLIEEVARMGGYDAIPTIMPSLPTAVWTAAPAADDQSRMRDAAVAEGYSEAISLAFNSPSWLQSMGIAVDDAVRLANPLGDESALLRTSLVAALLRAVKLNQSHLRTDVRLFELGRTFRWADRAADLPEETDRMALVLRGHRTPSSWAAAPEPVDVFDLKAAVEAQLAVFGIDGATWRPTQAVAWLHPRSATTLAAGEIELGVLGELHPAIAEKLDLDGAPVFVAELAVDALAAARGTRPVFSALPKFPAVNRDLSFYVAHEVLAGDLLAAIKAEAAERDLEAVEVFDVYEGEGLPAGKRSIAIKLRFRSATGTLTDADVDATQAAIISLLESRGADVRTG